MSETQEKTATSGTTDTMDRVKKMSLASFGGGRKPSPDEIASAVGGAFMGTIRGVCTGFRNVESTDVKTGEVQSYPSLTGSFWGQPADSSKPAIRSGTLYLPGGFHDDMLDIVAPIDPVSNERKLNGNEVTFAYDIVCIAAENKAGYSYRITPVLELKKAGGTDLLAQVKAAELEARAARNRALLGPNADGSDAPREAPAEVHKKAAAGKK